MSAFARYDPRGPTHAELDLENAAQIEQVFADCHPTLVVNAAAFHNVDACEAEPERALAVNAAAVGFLARACAKEGATLVHVSTEYVFEGIKHSPYDEDDATSPVDVYGSSKVAGERLVRESIDRHFIIRTSALFGRTGRSSKGPTFIERILSAAERGEPLKVVEDIVTSPSYAPHVARTIAELAGGDRFGTYHVTNGGYCSWLEFARAGIAELGLDTTVEATRFEPAPGAAKRPKFSALHSMRLAQSGVTPPPAWRDALSEYVAQRGTVPR